MKVDKIRQFILKECNGIDDVIILDMMDTKTLELTGVSVNVWLKKETITTSSSISALGKAIGAEEDFSVTAKNGFPIIKFKIHLKK